MKQVALSKVIQVMQYQIQLCTTPGYIKRQNYFIFAIIVNSLGFVNWLLSCIQIRKCQTIDWLFFWAVRIKRALCCIAGLQGTFSKTQMTCRHWLSLSGLEIVSEVTDIRGSNAIYQEKILSKYLVNQGTHMKDYHNSSWIKLCSQSSKSFKDMIMSLDVQEGILGGHSSHLERCKCWKS